MLSGLVLILDKTANEPDNGASKAIYHEPLRLRKMRNLPVHDTVLLVSKFSVSENNLRQIWKCVSDIRSFSGVQSDRKSQEKRIREEIYHYFSVSFSYIVRTDRLSK